MFGEWPVRIRAMPLSSQTDTKRLRKISRRTGSAGARAPDRPAVAAAREVNPVSSRGLSAHSSRSLFQMEVPRGIRPATPAGHQEGRGGILQKARRALEAGARRDLLAMIRRDPEPPSIDEDLRDESRRGGRDRSQTSRLASLERAGGAPSPSQARGEGSLPLAQPNAQRDDLHLGIFPRLAVAPAVRLMEGEGHLGPVGNGQFV